MAVEASLRSAGDVASLDRFFQYILSKNWGGEVAAIFFDFKLKLMGS